MPFMLVDLKLEDFVHMRKPHPCGGYEWKVVRLGADIGLECQTCGRRVLLSRRKLARRMKSIISTSDNASLPSWETKSSFPVFRYRGWTPERCWSHYWSNQIRIRWLHHHRYDWCVPGICPTTPYQSSRTIYTSGARTSGLGIWLSFK